MAGIELHQRRTVAHPRLVPNRLHGIREEPPCSDDSREAEQMEYADEAKAGHKLGFSHVTLADVQLSDLTGGHAKSRPKSSHPAKWGIGIVQPLMIVGGTVAALTIAIVHHVFDSALDGRSVQGFWSQTNSRRLENVLATIFQLIFSIAAGASLCEAAWYRVRRASFRLQDLDALLAPPSVWSLLRIDLIVHAPWAFLIIIAILVSPLVPVFAPSLVVREAGPATRAITVPTIDLATDKNVGGMKVNSVFYGPVSEAWDKASIQSLLSSTALGWPTPQECSPSCSYNISYAAVAVKCIDLASDEISDGLDSSNPNRPNRTVKNPPSAYLSYFDTAINTIGIFNFTAQDAIQPNIYNFEPPLQPSSDLFTWTVAYVPRNSTTGTIDGSVDPHGSVCTFYNATYEANASFGNGTQTNSVRVVEYHGPLNTTYKKGPVYDNSTSIDPYDDPDAPFASGVGPNINLLVMADALSIYLLGNIQYNGVRGLMNTNNTVAAKTNLFFENGTDFGLSPGITNLSPSLTELVGNMTLNYMHLNLGTTSVFADIPSTRNIYTYHRVSLLVTYGIGIAVLLATGSLGIFCLVSNGVPSSNQFSQVLATTRNPRLDALATGACLGTHGAPDRVLSQVRLRYGEVGHRTGWGDVHAAFGVVEEEEVRSLQKGGDYI